MQIVSPLIWVLCLALAAALVLAFVLLRQGARARRRQSELAAQARGLAEALEAERARAGAAEAAKARFLATVSHEFRTPLNGILGMAELIEETGLDAEQASYLAALRSSGDALLGLIDASLDLARLEAGRMELSEERFDLPFLVETVCELLAPQAQQKGIELASHLAPELPSHMLGDREKLRQILVNLVGNAIKFTASGGVGIRLAQEREELTVAVCDTGCGIAPGRLEAIFEEFEQAGESAAQRREGSGLGLAIVKRLALLMGGSVAVDSAPGRGSTFRVVLPLRAAPDASRPQVPDWRGRHVLIASPAPFGASFLAQMVESAGATARIAASAGQARALSAQATFEAVLVDLALGRDEALAIAADSGAAERVILLSPAERRAFGPPAEAGFGGFLIKPVRARSLFQHLFAPPAARSRPGPAGLMRVSAGRPRRLNMLVAEDNEINALLATRMLERLGCRSVWARDGTQALERFEAAREGQMPGFDLALIDIRMPLLDGLALARAIRARERAAGGRPLPLVAVSANAAEEDRAEAREAGMDDCLAKPLQRAALEAWLARLEGGRPRSVQA